MIVAVELRVEELIGAMIKVGADEFMKKDGAVGFMKI